jgi:hypothetical protein
MMPMPKNRGLVLRNERVPEFAYILLNRAISANYEFFIRGFSIWDNVEMDPRALKDGMIEYIKQPVFADTPARIQICGTEKVKVSTTPIRMVFQQLLKPTARDRGISYIREDTFKGNYTQSKGELCTINTYTATQNTST